MGRNAYDAEASNGGPNIWGEDNVYPFDARGEKILFTHEICVENPNQIGVDVTCEFDELLQVLGGEKLWESKAVSAKEGQFDVLVVDDFAIAKGVIEIFLSIAITDLAINIWILLLGCQALHTLARGRGGCHGGVV